MVFCGDVAGGGESSSLLAASSAARCELSEDDDRLFIIAFMLEFPIPRIPKFCPFPPELLMCDGDTIGGGGVGSGGGWNIEFTFGVFGVPTFTGPFELRLGEGLGTGIVFISLDVGVGGIMFIRCC